MNSKRYFNILFFLLASIGLWSCFGEVDPYQKEPAVKVRFFNIDSLTKLNTAIADIDTTTKYLNAEKTSLTTEISSLNAALTSLNAQIEEGNNGLIAERDAIQLQITEKTGRNQEVNTELATLDTDKVALNRVKSIINSGRIYVSKIVANGNETVFEDSATVFSLPLNMNATSQVYYIEIGGKMDSLELTYAVSEQLTSRSYFRLIGNNIERTEKYSFDSVQVFCNALPDPCISTSTTINVYL